MPGIYGYGGFLGSITQTVGRRFCVSVRDNASQPYDLSDCVFDLVLVRRTSATDPVLSVEFANLDTPQSGRATGAITVAQAIALPVGSYYYRLRMIDSEGRPWLLDMGRVRVANALIVDTGNMAMAVDLLEVVLNTDPCGSVLANVDEVAIVPGYTILDLTWTGGVGSLYIKYTPAGGGAVVTVSEPVETGSKKLSGLIPGTEYILQLYTYTNDEYSTIDTYTATTNGGTVIYLTDDEGTIMTDDEGNPIEVNL